MDDLPDPLTCPTCGTVLVDGRDGWACRHCGVLAIRNDHVWMPRDETPGIRGD